MKKNTLTEKKLILKPKEGGFLVFDSVIKRIKNIKKYNMNSKKDKFLILVVLVMLIKMKTPW